MDYDTRATILATEIKPDWTEEVRTSWQQNQHAVRNGLRAQFGEHQWPSKEENIIDLGAAPFSVVSYHNRFLREARNAFVIGAYYPALTAASALGERILNHLVLELRGDYADRSNYKRVHGKASFNNWPLMIDVLESWDVLVKDAGIAMRELRKVRTASIHFDSALATEHRSRALHALQLVSDVVSHQFGAFGGHSWFIPNAMGLSFLTKASVDEPFIRHFYLPSCALVGPRHTLNNAESGFTVSDPGEYEDREISDDEYLEMFRAGRTS